MTVRLCSIFFIACSILAALPCLPRIALSDCNSGLEGWEVLTSRYTSSIPPFIDGITFQWDYFMIHSTEFTGSIGYVVADPRGKLTGLMP